MRMLKNFGSLGILCLACTWLLGASTLAHGQSPAGSEQAQQQSERKAARQQRMHTNRQERRRALNERLAGMRRQILSDQVGLDGARKDLVEKVLLKFNTRKSEITQRMHANQVRIRHLLAEDSQDQAAYRQGLSEIQKAWEEIHRLRSEEVAELGKLLTPKEQAKFGLALQRVQRSLRSALHRNQERASDKRGRGTRANHANDSK